MSRRRARPPHWRSKSQRQQSMPEALDLILLQMSVEQWEVRFGDDAERAYREARGGLAQGIGSRVTVWWHYEPGIPDELRGTGSIADVEDHDLTRKRVSWLLRDGRHHLRPGEREKIGEVYATALHEGFHHGR